MSSPQTVEIDGDLIGILTPDHANRGFRFHSGVAPYDLLDGALFARPSEAVIAVRRIRHSARSLLQTVEKPREVVHELAA